MPLQPKTSRATPAKVGDSKTVQNRRLWEVGAMFGYVGQVATFDPDITNGGRLSLRLTFNRYFRMIFGCEVFAPITSQEEGAKIEVFRLPVHLGIGVLLPLEKWRIGAHLSAVLSYTKGSPKSLDEDVVLNPPSRRLLATMELLGTFAYRLTEIFSVFLGAGLEIIPQKVVYQVDNGPTLFTKFGHFQPKWMVGGMLNFR